MLGHSYLLQNGHSLAVQREIPNQPGRSWSDQLPNQSVCSRVFGYDSPETHIAAWLPTLAPLCGHLHCCVSQRVLRCPHGFATLPSRSRLTQGCLPPSPWYAGSWCSGKNSLLFLESSAYDQGARKSHPVNRRSVTKYPTILQMFLHQWIVAG